MSNYKVYKLNELDRILNIYDYFNRDNVWVFEHGDNMDEVEVTIHEGDLTINSMSDLPKNLELLIVKGNFIINDNFTLLGFCFKSFFGALIVTGAMYCKNLWLECGDIAISGNLNVEEYIYSREAEFEQGTLHVYGVTTVPYIFRGSDSLSYIFNKNDEVFINDPSLKDWKKEYENGEYYRPLKNIKHGNTVKYVWVNTIRSDKNDAFVLRIEDEYKQIPVDDFYKHLIRE